MAHNTYKCRVAQDIKCQVIGADIGRVNLENTITVVPPNDFVIRSFDAAVIGEML